MTKYFYFLLVFAATSLSAQVLDKAAGFRLGHTSAVTYKKFTSELEALELLVSGRNEGTQLTALYEFHKPLELSFDDRFYFYYGVGVHVGYEQYNRLKKVLVSTDPPDFVYEDKNYFVMGFDLIAGVEYRYLSAPLTIGFDVKPYFNFIGMRYTRSTFWDAALSVKYVF